jgi:hypothetical protein
MWMLFAALLSCLYFVYALDFREDICNSKYKRDVSSKEREREREKNFVCFYFG